MNCMILLVRKKKQKNLNLVLFFIYSNNLALIEKAAVCHMSHRQERPLPNPLKKKLYGTVVTSTTSTKKIQDWIATSSTSAEKKFKIGQQRPILNPQRKKNWGIRQ